MKITVVCDAFGPDNNRTAVAAKALIRAMKQRGHEVAVVCSDMTKAGKEGYVVISRRVSEIGLRGMEKEKLEYAVWDSDTVHIMTTSALGCAAVKLCRQHLIPVSADFYPLTQETGSIGAVNGIVYRRLYLSLYRYADAVRFPSKLSREMFEKAVGHQIDAFIIPNGVGESFCPNDAQKPREWKDRFVILYCAPLIRGKGHRVLIDAVGLSKYGGRIQLVFAGSGSLKSALKKQGGKLKHQPVSADYPYSQLPNLYNCADLYIDPARVDTDAASCMEALACGLVPLIADSPRNAAGRLAPDAHYLFACGNAQELADKIDRVIECPEILQAYRDKYDGIAKELSRDACMERMEEMFFAIR